jgi:hypothetical protein
MRSGSTVHVMYQVSGPGDRSVRVREQVQLCLGEEWGYQVRVVSRRSSCSVAARSRRIPPNSPFELAVDAARIWNQNLVLAHS